MIKPLDYKITLPIFILLLTAGFVEEYAFDYGFYTFLRIATCGYFIYKCFTYKPATAASVPVNFIISGVFAVLFNPFILIKLEFGTWQIIDLLAACYMCYLEYAKIVVNIVKIVISWIKKHQEKIKTALFIIFAPLFIVFIFIAVDEYFAKSAYHKNSQAPKEYLITQNKKCSCWVANYVYRPHEKPRIFSYVIQEDGREILKDVTNWIMQDIKTGADKPITCEDQNTHLEATAPDGSKLDIRGCQMPTRRELSEIFYVMMTNPKEQPQPVKVVTKPKLQTTRKPKPIEPTPPQEDEPTPKPILSIFGRTLWGN